MTPPIDHAAAESLKAICTNCGGEGKEIVGEFRVTRDMAIDAGDRSMEGMFHSYAYDQCSKCKGTSANLEFVSLPH